MTSVVDKLSLATCLDEITQIVADAARRLTGADGATFVLRDGETCYYVDENAISSLWKGKRFPIEDCISGWSMLNQSCVVIEDIYKDARIPHEAYRPTFVKSLCVVPIREKRPMGAIGNYWGRRHKPPPEDVKLLQVLANSAAVALENLELKQSVLRRSLEREAVADQKRDLENAIHTMAHDLMGPLAAMMGCAEVLKVIRGPELQDEEKSYINSILTTGRQASFQIKRMLSLYSVTNRNVEKQRLDLSGMADELIAGLKSQLQGREVSFEVQPGLHAFAEPIMLRMVLENLLSNAVKYSSKKKLARIWVGKLEDSMQGPTFFVRDNGEGFHAEEGYKLFRPLVRLHQDREFEGTGLGLASVARLIQMHGGSVRAEGQKGEGASFYFSLPV